LPDPAQQEALCFMRDYALAPAMLDPSRFPAALAKWPKLAKVIDLAKHPTQKMLAVNQELTDFFDAHLKEGQRLKFLDSQLTNEKYITHIMRPVNQSAPSGPAVIS
jgi:hypothetical protein